jgi:hypothetical protein
MDVPVTLKLFDREPEITNDNIESVGQINECDIEATSDKLVIAGCTDYFPDAKGIDVDEGIYRARIYYGNLDKISEDGLDGDDSYEIHLWPTKETNGLKVVKSKTPAPNKYLWHVRARCWYQCFLFFIPFGNVGQ